MSNTTPNSPSPADAPTTAGTSGQATAPAVAVATPPVVPPPNQQPPFTGPADPVAAHWWQRALVPTLIVVLTAGLVALREVDRLVGSILGQGDHYGDHASVGEATGLAAGFNTDAWQIWASSDLHPGLAGLMNLYFWADLAYMIGYGALLVVLLSAARVAQAMVVIAVLADFAEGIALLIAAETASAGGSSAGVAVAALAYTKWLFLLLAVACGFGIHRVRATLFRRSIRAAIAGGTHRLSVLFLLGFGFLSLAPIGGVNDQLPDVQRQWFDDGAWLQAVWATMAIIVTAVLLWYLGRRRTERTFRQTLGERWAAEHSLLGWWVTWPGSIFAVALIAAAAGAAPAIGGLAVPAVVVAIAVGAACMYGSARLADVAAEQGTNAGRARWFGASVAVLAVLAVLAVSFGAGRFMNPLYFVIVAGTAGALLVSSLVVVMKRNATVSNPWVPPERPMLMTRWLLDVKKASSDGDADTTWRERAVRTTWLVGDAIAVLTLALAPLGLIRSLMGPIAQARLPTGSSAELAPTSAAIVTVFVLACLAAPAVPLLAAALLRWNAEAQLIPHGGGEMVTLPSVGVSASPRLFDPRVVVPVDDPIVSRLDVGIVAFWALVITIALVLPQGFAAALGPTASTILLMTAWGGILGGLMLSLQRRRPLPVFVQLGFRSTPVLTLTLVLLLATSWFINPAELHAVRVIASEPTRESTSVTDAGADAAATADQRMSAALSAEFADWKGRMTACSPQPTAWPLVLIAAEGGGGRAAYWTVDGMSRLRADPGSGCLDESLFAASGISGGSVGLAIDQLSAGDPGEESSCVAESRASEGSLGVALASVTCLTGPDPLARVVTGMLAGDLVAGGAGVRVPSVDGQWADRAAHLETGWEQQATALAGGYSATGRSGPFLLLNSADSVSGCRVTVVQLDMARASSWPGAERLSLDDCGSPATGAGATIDFDTAWPGCASNLRWSTVALLSARFPFVTPGGRMVVPDGLGCAGDPGAQLVDGGYAEGSGLGALSDILPEVTSLIALHNTCVDGSAASEAAAESAADSLQPGVPPPVCAPTDKPVVPLVVYLKNERGFEVDAAVEGLAAEVLVPLAGTKASSQQIGEKAWLQRISDQLQTVATPDSCALAVCERRIAVVSSSTSPTIAAPLGWTLSGSSRKTLDDAMDLNERTCSDDGDPWSTLGDLIGQLGNRTVCEGAEGPDPLG